MEKTGSKVGCLVFSSILVATIIWPISQKVVLFDLPWYLLYYYISPNSLTQPLRPSFYSPHSSIVIIITNCPLSDLTKTYRALSADNDRKLHKAIFFLRWSHIQQFHRATARPSTPHMRVQNIQSSDFLVAPDSPPSKLGNVLAPAPAPALAAC